MVFCKKKVCNAQRIEICGITKRASAQSAPNLGLIQYNNIKCKKTIQVG